MDHKAELSKLGVLYSCLYEVGSVWVSGYLISAFPPKFQCLQSVVLHYIVRLSSVSQHQAAISPASLDDSGAVAVVAATRPPVAVVDPRDAELK